MTEAGKPRLDTEGTAAPPRRNGELVFQSPWEGRAFGLAVALGDTGLFPWEAFRQRLIAAIAAADREPESERRPAYYESWLASLQAILVESGTLTADEIERRVQEFATGERDIVNPDAPAPAHASQTVRPA